MHEGISYEHIPPLSEDAIVACTNLDEVVALLRQHQEPVPGASRDPKTGSAPSGSKVAQYIEQVRHGHRLLDFVTNACGIRTFVELTLPHDPIYNSPRTITTMENQRIPRISPIDNK